MNNKAEEQASSLNLTESGAASLAPSLRRSRTPPADQVSKNNVSICHRIRAVTLKPGQGEHLEVSTGAWPTRRLAVLSTGTLKKNWNQLLTSTPYVASNQWDQLQFDRSFSQWLPGPPWVPAPPTATP